MLAREDVLPQPRIWSREHVLVALALLATAGGVRLAIARAWLCDDAFISFRYADNLVHGLGLVFNAGERVEGYTNLLWTLWMALGLRLGVAADRWAIVWGIGAYAGLLLLIVAAARDRRLRGPGLLALSLALLYGWYVVRVGGDFMYARLLIPVTPFLIVLLATGLAATFGERVVPHTLATVACAAALALTPSPVGGLTWVHGVADEWKLYRVIAPGRRAAGETLARLFDGLPIRVAFLGTEAQTVYYARPALAVESATGLTDAFIAHLPLATRGRVGHEKMAPADYLVDVRNVHFILRSSAPGEFGAYIPAFPIDLGGVQGRVLHWDPPVMAALRARGARFPDVTAELDRYLAGLARLSPKQRLASYCRWRHFYFEHVVDVTRGGRSSRSWATR